MEQESETMMKLFSHQISSCSRRVRLALHLKGLIYECINITSAGDPELLKVNPMGYVPALVDGTTVVSDSYAILLYLEEKFPQHALLPQDLIRKSINYQVASIVSSSIQPLQNTNLVNYIGELKWAIEGDENSKFFHGFINSKFSRSRINGVLFNGVWVTDPPLVMSHIFNFHKQKFANNIPNRPCFTSNKFKTLSTNDLSLLDAPFTSKEIKDAVWDCGGGKAPGPDGFTFKFIKHYWGSIGTHFVEMVKRFETDGFIPRGCNSSFIALVPKKQDPLYINDYRPISLIGCQYKVIAKVLANRLQKVVHSVVSEVQTAYIKGRQIIDGPLMVNEIISWASKKKERLFIFKVDFEKAFDSLDWNFLDNVMQQMGFSHNWRKWIRGCLTSSFSSVVVNGSPTKEFNIQRGLRQGDPLSPFLFIIAVEALHVTFQEAKAKGIFGGVKIGSSKVDISHLQFADDAIILGKWSLENARSLCHILRCFNLASGLKVNFSKSKLFGIGVNAIEKQSFANILNCEVSTFPCSYLGLPIGANMKKACNWKPIVEKFHKRLTSWKARNLSYGGRLTLLKSVLGALGTYFFSLFLSPKCVINYLEKLRCNFFWGGTLDCNKMAWIGWKKVCSSSSCGGLGIGNLHAANLAMLTKWWWRFHSEKDTLWKDIITSIHGTIGGYGSIPTNSTPLSPWKTIICLDKHLSCANTSLESIFIRQLGDGSLFSFWWDKWIGATNLKTMFPRLFSLELHKQCTIRDICSSNNGLQQFNFKWRRPIRDGPEATQYNGLLELLSEFVVVDTPDHSGHAPSLIQKPIRSLLVLFNKIAFQKKNIGELVSPDEKLPWAQYHIRKGFVALEKLLANHAGKYATGDEIFLADLFLAPQIDNALNLYNVDMTDFPLLLKLNKAYSEVPSFQLILADKPQEPSDFIKLH